MRPSSSLLPLPSPAPFVGVRFFGCCSEPPELLEDDLRDPAQAMLCRLSRLDDECLALQTRLSSDLAVSSSVDKHEAHRRVEAVQTIRKQIDYLRTLEQAASNMGAIDEANRSAAKAREEEEDEKSAVSSKESTDRGEASLCSTITDEEARAEERMRKAADALLGATPPPPVPPPSSFSGDRSSLEEIESRAQEAKERQVDGKKRIKDMAAQTQTRQSS